jgi:DNA polymerase III sliding clamp (beta) subunit (PCNA family)
MAKQALTPLDYCNRAVGTDGRMNLEVPYMDGYRIVSTDGHRLHLVDGLPNAGKGYIDGRDCQFPDYEQVLPKREKLRTVATVELNKGQVDHLKRLVKTFKNKHCDCVIEAKQAEGCLVITGKYTSGCESLNGSFSVRIPAECQRPFRAGLNLSYFVDALISDGIIIPPFTLETQEPSAEATTSALVIRYDTSPSYVAIVMPLRID